MEQGKSSEQPLIDVEQRCVRIREQRPDGFVEFEFSFSDPDLFVEMILPQAEFEAFCAANRVRFLAPREAAGEGDEAGWTWNLYDATHTRFRE